MLKIPVPNSSAEAIRVRDMNARIEYVLQMVQYWDAAHATALQVAALPDKIRAEMAGWHDSFFKGSCQLFAKESDCRVVLGDSDKREDVVIRSFLFEDHVVATYETSRQIALFLPKRTTNLDDAESLHGAVQTVSTNCLDAELVWGLRAKSELEGSVALTTNPYQSIWNAPFWHSRVDAGTLGNRIFILLYKRVNQRMGFPDGLWFDDAFRAHVKGLQATQK